MRVDDIPNRVAVQESSQGIRPETDLMQADIAEKENTVFRRQRLAVADFRFNGRKPFVGHALFILPRCPTLLSGLTQQTCSETQKQICLFCRKAALGDEWVIFWGPSKSIITGGLEVLGRVGVSEIDSLDKYCSPLQKNCNTMPCRRIATGV